MNKRLLISLILLTIIVLFFLAYKIGNNNETVCKFTFGNWIKAGVYGPEEEIKWKVERDYCNRPLLFGLIKRV